ncbi:MAG: glycosyltransferase family 39 protein [Candidatus Omnitrophica bacterium]|nr:glycosyltransferase family 39 protein [Candidatus Omnitrophota bacterium]
MTANPRRLKTIFIILVLAGLIIRIIAVLKAPLTLAGDEIAYYQIAKRFLTEGDLLNSSGMPTAYRPPVYFLFLSGVFSLTHDSVMAAKILQAFLSIGIVLVIYKISRRLLGEKAAQASFFTSLFYLPFILAPTRLYSEIVFTLFLVTAFFYFTKLYEKPAIPDAIKAGIFMGLSVLTRAAALVMMPFFLAVLVWAHYLRGKTVPLQRLIGILGVFVAVFGMILSPWVVRNYRAFGTVKYSTETGMALYVCYFPEKGKIFSKIPREDPVIQESLLIESELQKEHFLINKTFEKLRQSPARIVDLVPLKLVSLLSPFHWELYHETIYDWSYVFLFPFFLAGLVMLGQRPRALVPLSIPILAVLLITIVFYGSSRIRFPMEPFSLIIASYGLYQILHRRLLKMNVGILCWLGINLWASFHLIQVKSWLRNIATVTGIW